MHNCYLYKVLSGCVLQVTGPFCTPCYHSSKSTITVCHCPLPPHPHSCMSFMHLHRYTNHLGHPGPSCFHPYQLQLYQSACGFLITHHLGLFLVFASVSSSVGFVSLCAVFVVPPLLVMPFGIGNVLDQIPIREQRLSPFTYPCTNRFASIPGKLKTLLQCRVFLFHNSFILYFLKPFHFVWKSKSFQKVLE